MNYCKKADAEFENKIIYKGVEYTEDRPKTIDGADGAVTVTKGNYIFTDPDGNKFCVAADDVESIYQEV